MMIVKEKACFQLQSTLFHISDGGVVAAKMSPSPTICHLQPHRGSAGLDRFNWMVFLLLCGDFLSVAVAQDLKYRAPSNDRIHYSVVMNLMRHAC